MVLMIIRELVKCYGRIEQCKMRNIYGCVVLCDQLLLQSKNFTFFFHFNFTDRWKFQ